MTYIILSILAFVAGALVGYSSGYEAGFEDQEDENYGDRIAGS